METQAVLVVRLLGASPSLSVPPAGQGSPRLRCFADRVGEGCSSEVRPGM